MTNQKTTVTIKKEQQSFEVKNHHDTSQTTIDADHIIAGSVLVGFKCFARDYNAFTFETTK